MQAIQLYIKNDDTNAYERVEMFEDESVSITQSIKNAKDVSKVFTTFTRQFTVPASKINNKIFIHYYNYEIQDGFDARIRKDAKIELNSLPFRNGKLRLDGVDMRDNKPFSYRVTFFGSIVELKDVLGEDKLFSLDDLDIDKGYAADDVRTALTSAADSDGCLIPLITHNQRLYYDSGRPSQQSGNLYYNGTVQGVKFLELKYAIQLRKILDAIESKYSEITFSSTSFFKDNSTYPEMSNLYMWCHRKKGALEIPVGPLNVVSGFNPSENATSIVLKVQSDTQGVMIDESTRTADVLTFETTVSSSSSYTNFMYDVVIYRDTGSGYELYQEQNRLIGDTVVTVLDPLVHGYKYKAYIRTYESSSSFSSMSWKCSYSGATSGQDSFSVSNKTYSQSFDFNIKEQMPEMKIIDFLSSLFKMFNLVAYVDDSSNIQVKPLDDFYESKEHDITKYIDITESKIDSALPYKEIFFKYKDTKTILANQHLQELSDVEWGGNEYTQTGNLDGEIYKVEPDFHHAKYEKLIDISSTGVSTDIQCGYFVSDNEEAYLGSPLILYVASESANDSIGLIDRSTVKEITTSASINMPSNLETITNNNSKTLHFGLEKNEYTNVDASNSLFERYYKSYIQNVFNPTTRLIRVNAVLPISKIIDIDLSDVIVINSRKYRINAMTTNLADGKTDFELINYYG